MLQKHCSYGTKFWSTTNSCIDTHCLTFVSAASMNYMEKAGGKYQNCLNTWLMFLHPHSFGGFEGHFLEVGEASI